MEYIIYCDESSDKGPEHSDFFGGCAVTGNDYDNIVKALNNRKAELKLCGEIKWVKVTEQYLDRYIQMMDLFFDFIRDGKIKMRVMFRNNRDIPSDPKVAQDKDTKYYKLYYQFLKHAFGLMDIPPEAGNVFLRVYLDQLPKSEVENEPFKEYVRKMPDIQDARKVKGRLHIREGSVTEVCSHDHVLLQCADIVLGSMYFRLNNLHKTIPPGKKKRGKRTIAKEKLYKHIHRRIEEILPGFNIGVSTGDRGYDKSAWSIPYSHWKFKPK